MTKKKHSKPYSRKVQAAFWRHKTLARKEGRNLPPLSRHGFIERTRSLLLFLKMQEK